MTIFFFCRARSGPAVVFAIAFPALPNLYRSVFIKGPPLDHPISGLVLLIQEGNTVESTLTTKGQVTIPKEVRDQLHLAPGDKVKFFIQPDGRLVILPKLPASALRGMFRSRVGPVSLEDMDAGIMNGATRRLRRANRK
jgi:antitoxin PrlF